LIFAARITFAHCSVCSTTNLSRSAGELANTVAASSAIGMAVSIIFSQCGTEEDLKVIKQLFREDKKI
jgi:hypothetical protein